MAGEYERAVRSLCRVARWDLATKGGAIAVCTGPVTHYGTDWQDMLLRLTVQAEHRRVWVPDEVRALVATLERRADPDPGPEEPAALSRAEVDEPAHDPIPIWVVHGAEVRQGWLNGLCAEGLVPVRYPDGSEALEYHMQVSWSAAEAERDVGEWLERQRLAAEEEEDDHVSEGDQNANEATDGFDWSQRKW